MNHGKNGDGLKRVEAPHLYVGTPCHDNRWHVMMAMSMIRLVGAHQFSLTTNKCSGGGVHKARNNIAHDFLTKSTCQKLIWIDSDISFAPEQVYQLYQRNLPIVSIPYCHKKPELDWSAKAMDGIGPNEVGLQEVAAVGTGFQMVDRSVFEAIKERFGKELSYVEDWNEGKGEIKYDFFKEGVVLDPEFGYDKPTFVTEDFYFCYMARKCGFKIQVDCTSYVTHWDGARGYPEKPPAPPQEKMPEYVNETDILNFAR